MSEPYQSQNVADPQSTMQPEQSGGGGGGKCLLFGCLGVVLLVVLACGGVFFGGTWWLKSQVAKYTSETPADIPVVEMAEEEVEAIKTRTTQFKESVDAGDTPEPLILTADEINGMIADDENLSGRLFVTIEDGNVTGDVSIPADVLPGGIGDGRFFNATATFDVSINDGRLDVRLVDAVINEEPLPKEFMDALSRENLAKDVGRDNPEIEEFLQRIESLRVEDDRIILIPKPPQEEGAGEAVEDGALPAEDEEDATSAEETTLESPDPASAVESPEPAAN